MAKNKDTTEMKKTPFNAFKKGALTIALAGALVTAPIMLGGCDPTLDLKGATFHTGTQYSAETGELGDFFYDTDDCDIYQKTADGWTLISNIKGDQGANGAAWITGSAVTGTGNSINATVQGARIGDLYLNDTGANAGNLYKCTAANTWQFIININGEDGEDGETPTPIKGDRGATWMIGALVTGTGNSITANVPDAVVGDLYLNITGDDAGNIYQCTAENTWKYLVNINGEDGEDGEDASNEILDNYYYSVSSADELDALIDDGAQCFKLNADIVLNQALVPTTDMNFDLNNFTLSYNGADRMEIHAQGPEEGDKTPINVEFRNGKIDFRNTNGSSTIVVDTGCSITMRDVDYTSDSTALFPRGDTAKVEIIDSTITAKAYAVGTNASLKNGVPEYMGIQIVLKDSVLTSTSDDFDNTAVMINVPGSLSIDGCELTGDRQALLARGGDTIIRDTKLICTGDYLEKNTAADRAKYQPTPNALNPMMFEFNTAWGTGNAVPSAAIVVGNNTAGYYQYETNIDIDTVEIIGHRRGK